MNNDKSQKVAKKGLVVNRRYNRTVNQDIAQSAPKWEDIGMGVLKRKGSPFNYAKVGALGKLVPLNRHQIRFYLNAISSAKEAALKALAGNA